MEEILNKLGNAIENQGDINECISLVAENFEKFLDSDEIYDFPDFVIEVILMSPSFVVPNSEKICAFFIKLFERGQNEAHFFADLVPFDKMCKKSVLELSNKLNEMGMHIESMRFKRICNMYEALDLKDEELKQTQKVLQGTAEQLDRSSNFIPQVSELLAKTTKALNQTRAELDLAREELEESKKEIISLKAKRLMKRR